MLALFGWPARILVQHYPLFYADADNLCRFRLCRPGQRSGEEEEEVEEVERDSLGAAGGGIGAAWSVNINQSSKLKASDRRTQSGGNGDTDDAAAR